MTELEHAKIFTDLLNALSPMFIASFIFGIVTGVFFFGRLVDSIDRLGSRLRRPNRIKAARDFGEHGDFEYLYLFKGRYYCLGEFQQLKQEAKNNFLKRIKKQGANS
ncbi:hypothetical protein F4U02_00945 [Acinetobacter haemolyticus]|uniref:hypothetical protein n=1 Tax=Acinetobacter haemolyticus TaxID=29430 RepID=UPI0012988931|nr:hypothetical protein [Acinetobacter haemolyticus]MQZ29580.1 hypothetical protein [Acinetobacter haemolyticus]